MTTPEFEQSIGIDSFSTSEPGIGGKLRVRIDDFQVTEIFQYPTKAEAGRFTIAEVTSRNWETHTLVRSLAHLLHVSQHRISFAGTKDKRSISTQLMSFDSIPPEKVASITLEDVVVQNIYSSDIPVRLGDLQGNRFLITVRNIEPMVTPRQVKQLLAPFNAVAGFPNFFGVQRFGIIRPITHLVGKYIVQGEYERAVMTYVAHPLPGESEEVYGLRAELEKTRDYQHAFHTYPDVLHFEKAMLNALIKDSSDFVGALQQLPKNLLLMFVNAYQSYLFNKMLSERLRRHLPIHETVPGDLILPFRKKSTTEEYIPVSAANLAKVNIQLSKKKALVTGALIGADALFAGGEMGEIEQQIINDEHLDPRDFIIPEIPFLSSSGSRRGLLALLPSLEWTLHPDDLFEDRQKLTLTFELSKGCYATSLLREIMKSDSPKNY
ncbi:MAG: tRNA pseudouridine(13) synthase TruD [Candidatus Thermoplasmatota archaeon]|nr:tRNA pseudouridine(13) synthase TruD [Candidatus Thermoplasmatota archaeon]